MLEEPVLRETPTWSLQFFCSLVGIALVSGLSVFLFLYHHDLSTISTVRAMASAAGKGNVAVHEAPRTAAETALSPGRAVTSPDPVAARSSSLDFRLKRSRGYQTIGPVELRLVRVNVKRRTCDLSLRLNDRRMVQKRLQLNKPFELKPASSTEPLQLSISTIGRDSVAGSLSTLAASTNTVKE